ncbi:MAG TPA: hypothetical protein VGV93_10470 [Acidimicrobiales bacterium]|nr:hypothetical protein [Acidimicrobiales bacterium]
MDALRNRLVPAGEGRHRVLAARECALLAHLLAGDAERRRWALHELAGAVFGSDLPGDAASPLWKLRSAGLVEVDVVDSEEFLTVEVAVDLDAVETLTASAPTAIPDYRRKDTEVKHKTMAHRGPVGPRNAATLTVPALQRTLGTVRIDSEDRLDALYQVLAEHREAQALAAREFRGLVRAAGLEHLPACSVAVEDLAVGFDGEYRIRDGDRPAEVAVDFSLTLDPDAVRKTLTHELTHHLAIVGEGPTGRAEPRPLVAAPARASVHGFHFVAAGRLIAERLGIAGPTVSDAEVWPWPVAS